MVYWRFTVGVSSIYTKIDEIQLFLPKSTSCNPCILKQQQQQRTVGWLAGCMAAAVVVFDFSGWEKVQMTHNTCIHTYVQATKRWTKPTNQQATEQIKQIGQTLGRTDIKHYLVSSAVYEYLSVRFEWYLLRCCVSLLFVFNSNSNSSSCNIVMLKKRGVCL